MALTVNTFPIRLRQLHVACLQPPSGPSVSHERLMPSLTGPVGERLKNRTILHSEGTSSALVESLQRQGLSKRVIPYELGGEWMYNEFGEWRRQRLTDEQGGRDPQPKNAGESLDELNFTLLIDHHVAVRKMLVLGHSTKIDSCC